MIEFQLIETGQSLEVYQIGIADSHLGKVHRIHIARTVPDGFRTKLIKRGKDFCSALIYFSLMHDSQHYVDYDANGVVLRSA